MNQNNFVKLMTLLKDISFRVLLGKVEKVNPNNGITTENRKGNLFWISVAVLALLLSGIGVYGYLNYYHVNQNQNLGTYDNPEVAFRETQKVLSILSTNLNVGIESVQYIEEYENSKNLIFKQQ